MKRMLALLLAGLLIATSAYASGFNSGTSGGGGGTGDVTSVGDCTSGACLDGTSDGGTHVDLYDGDSNKATINTANLSGNRTFTLPNETGTVCTTGSVCSGYQASGSVSDTAYDATSWNGVTTIAPSKNAVRDKLEAMVSTEVDPAISALYDAQTILRATSDNTPAALTVGEQTVVGRATGGNIAALAIDSDLASTSGSDDTVPSAKAAKAYVDAAVLTAGSGDVLSVGDCVDGACLDGSSDGGTYARFYDGDSNYGAIVTANLTANRVYTFPNATGTVSLTDSTEGLSNKTMSAAFNDVHADDALALAANGANCAAGEYNAGVDASGAAEGCTDATTEITSIADAKVSDTAYDATSWNGVTTIAPSKNAVRDQFELVQPLDADLTTYAGITPSANVQTLLGSADFAAFRTSLGADTVVTAGRSLTRTTDDIAADPELYTETHCYRLPANPVNTDDDKSIWLNNTANQFTVTKLWCESDQTVTAMLQVDDGSPADMDSVDLSCTSTPATDTSLDGDNTIAAGDRVDLDVASVSGTPTWAEICFTGTWDD